METVVENAPTENSDSVYQAWIQALNDHELGEAHLLSKRLKALLVQGREPQWERNDRRIFVSRGRK